MPAHPASVPAARRFVDEALSSWGREELRDDVGLSVSELVTNATLHSRSSHFDVELRLHEDGLHVAVEDGGQMPARSIAARASAIPAHADQAAAAEAAARPGGAGEGQADDRSDDEGDLDDALDAESMTGRGLFIVAALASSWGIDDLPRGTRVWAEFADDEDAAVTTDGEAPVLSTLEGPGPSAAADASPAAGPVVRLRDCPADLLLAYEESLNDVARELSLLSAGHEDGEAARSAAEIADVVRVAALGWSAARIVALEAVREGRRLVDVDLPVAEPDDLVRRVAAVEHILERADEMARAGQLISLPAPPALRRFRAWLAAEMTEQVCTGRDPLPFGT
jgi:hypothetical protein